MSNAGGVTRIGVLGTARIARRSVIPAILNLPNQFELVAIASRTRLRCEEMASEFGCRPVIGYDQLVDSREVDALYIPLPTGLHKEWINKAIAAGKHVYAEKSLSYSYADAERMVGSAGERGVALMEGLMFQYHSQHQRVRDLLQRNLLGQPRHFFGAFGFPPLPANNFRYDEELGGGALLDAAPYPLRAAHLILGEELQVRSSTLYVEPGKGTNIYGSAFLSDGRGLGAALAFGFDNSYRCFYEVWGSKGRLTVRCAYTPRPDTLPEIQLETLDGTQTIHCECDNHFERAFEEFHRAIRGGEARRKQYRAILTQSRSLEDIRILAASGIAPWRRSFQ